MDGSFSVKDEDSSSSSSGCGGGSGGEKEEGTCASPVPSFVLSSPAEESKLSPTVTAALPQISADIFSSSSPQKRSVRRSVQKRVVSIPITDTEGSRSKGGSDCAPPPDSWTWRKYGQKPIKGSPYPRGYYRCSSSKGCPARKRVERSRADPTMLVITYACEHNHPWPIPKNQTQNQSQNHQLSIISGPPVKQEPESNVSPPRLPASSSSPSSVGEDQPFSGDLIGSELPMTMMANEFSWFSDVSASPPPAETFLCSPIACGGEPMALPADQESDFTGSEGPAPEEEEEAALFAGLGVLPECAVVFRRGLFDRPTRMQIDGEDNPLLWHRRMREQGLEIDRDRERGCAAASR